MAEEEAASPVWRGTVDGEKFVVQVDRTDNSHVGRLFVKEIASDETLLTEDVGLMYGAQFGPDVSDVAEWQAKSLPVIDAWYAAHGQTPPQAPDEQPT